MESSLAPGIWVVLAFGLCGLCWFLGDLRGAARMTEALAQRPVAMDDEAGPDAIASVPQSEERVGGASRARLASEPAMGAICEFTPAERKEGPADGMPSLAQLSQQAERAGISARKWDHPDMPDQLRNPDPVSAQILVHYRKSVGELRSVAGLTPDLDPLTCARRAQSRDPRGQHQLRGTGECVRACPAA